MGKCLSYKMEIKKLKPIPLDPDSMKTHFDDEMGEWVANFSFAGRPMTLCLGFFDKKAEKQVLETAELLQKLIFHSIPPNSDIVEMLPNEFALSGTAIDTEDILEQQIEAQAYLERTARHA